MKVTNDEKDALWKEFKVSDKFRLLAKLSPYDQWEVCFKEGIDSILKDDMIVLKREEWESIKRMIK